MTAMSKQKSKPALWDVLKAAGLNQGPMPPLEFAGRDAGVSISFTPEKMRKGRAETCRVKFTRADGEELIWTGARIVQRPPPDDTPRFKLTVSRSGKATMRVVLGFGLSAMGIECTYGTDPAAKKAGARPRFDNALLAAGMRSTGVAAGATAVYYPPLPAASKARAKIKKKSSRSI